MGLESVILGWILGGGGIRGSLPTQEVCSIVNYRVEGGLIAGNTVIYRVQGGLIAGNIVNDGLKGGLIAGSIVNHGLEGGLIAGNTVNSRLEGGLIAANIVNYKLQRGGAGSRRQWAKRGQGPQKGAIFEPQMGRLHS